MAKKAKKAKKTGRRPTPQEQALIEQILDEMKESVLYGLSPKTFVNDNVEKQLRITMRPKVFRRLLALGNWEMEKARPLLVAQHMGQIAKLLAKGDTVDLTVADAARVAAKADENCPRSGSGGGDWCF